MTDADRTDEILYPPMEAAEVRRLRQESGLSQAGFAGLLGAHKRTVQRWEAGSTRPTGAALALLTVAKRRGIQILT
ncbi:helix-turn-helix domain-containing protein [Novosphingobium panipatense]|uniref:Transcriptional regulator n=1 Tax=Novosphingobium panipatense TaxID=428991 RepID=A0ABY1QXN9_9SPHN|nr:helix-turn-helix domain-containing protein [Novosphingobium panipatense]SMP82306.1 putative transcriptional regulator [Novosphingobium panipatense]